MGLHPLQRDGCQVFLPAGLIICVIRPAVPVLSRRGSASASASALHLSVESPETLTAGVPNFICGSRQQFSMPCSPSAK